MMSQQLGTKPSVAAGCPKLPSAVPSRQSSPNPIAQANLQNISSVAVSFTTTDAHGEHLVGYRTVVAVPVLQALS